MHRIAVYFGLEAETDEERREREGHGREPVGRLLLRTTVAAIIAGAVFGLAMRALDGDPITFTNVLRSGLLLGLFMWLFWLVPPLRQRRRANRRSVRLVGFTRSAGSPERHVLGLVTVVLGA
jgi:hypothetical protein